MKGAMTRLILLTGSEYVPPAQMLARAFDNACDEFQKAHGREPDFDILNIRAGFSTTTLVLEIDEGLEDDDERMTT